MGAEDGIAYTAYLYDENGVVEDSADYDDLDEAIRFAKMRGWDAVVDNHTGLSVWRLGG